MGGHRHRVEDTMMMESVGDAPVVIVNVGIDIVVSKVVCIVESKVSDLARTMSKIYAI